MIDKDLINKKKKKFKIRYLTLKDLDDFNNLLRYAFQVSNNELITLYFINSPPIYLLI